MKTKIQLINAAFKELRISSLTSGPSAHDVESALEVLEDMMREICAKYPTFVFNFEEVPDPNTESGIPAWANNAIQLKLADAIGAEYNKKPDMMRLAAAWSSFCAKLSPTPTMANSVNMPSGRGNTQWLYNNSDRMPVEELAHPESKLLGLGDSILLSEDFSDYLRPGETVLSVGITADAGLSMGASTLTGNTVSVEVTSTGIEGVNLKVSINITGSISTIRKRNVYFTVSAGLAVGE